MRERTTGFGPAASEDSTNHHRFLGMHLAPNQPHPTEHPAATGPCLLVGTADEQWVVRQISVDEHGMLDDLAAELLGTSLLDHVHPGDAADLREGAVAAISEQRSTSVAVNVGRPGRWRRTRIAITPMVHGPRELGFAMQRVGPGDPVERSMQLEQHMWRIARELEAARISLRGPGGMPDLEAILGPDALSARQWEVLRRLLQGERVPGIAQSLFLSPSTVRNHLTSIFAKFGVHSQAELIRLLRARSGDLSVSA